MEQEVGRSSDKMERVARAITDSIAENAMVGGSIADLLNDPDTLRLAAIAACEAEAGERERVLREALEQIAEDDWHRTCEPPCNIDGSNRKVSGKFAEIARAALNTTAGEGL